MSDEETPESQPEKVPTEAPPPQPPQGVPEKPANPTTALILSIAGLLCCAPVAIFGILMGNKVKKQISEGRNDPANASTATVAQIIGYVALGLWAIGIVLGLITGAFTSKEVSREISDSVGATPAASAAGDAGLNTPVRDGKFEFTVKSFKCGEATIASPEFPALKSDAQGQFCVADLSVKNTGNVGQNLDYTSQKLIDSEGRKLDPDFGVIGYLNGSDWAQKVGTINPGVTVDLKIAWDVAKDGKFTTIIVHDSPFSQGAKVKVA